MKSFCVMSLLVPCAPQNVSTNLLCGNNDVMVSWTLSPEPLNYTVKAMPVTGNTSSVTCNTNSASCNLTGLQCGWTYNISVKASSGSCCGPYSSPQTIQTGKKKGLMVKKIIVSTVFCYFDYFMSCGIFLQHPAPLKA